LLRGQEFSLKHVQENYKNLTYNTLDTEERRKLDNSIIHSTIIRQEEPTDDQSSIYLIFERLNTGGTTLYPQEIRVALYRGPFIALLRELNEYQLWRNIYGKKSKRFKDQELILRFFAMLFWSDNYKRPMKDFLNKYMEYNREFQHQKEDVLRNQFTQTIQVIGNTMREHAFRLKTAINAAVFDSIMVGVANRISEKGNITDFKGLNKAYNKLLENKDYRSSVEHSTSDEENVRTRLQLAKEIMLKVR
jgi:hypothetical protein